MAGYRLAPKAARARRRPWQRRRLALFGSPQAQTVVLGVADETDTALALDVALELGVAAETDTALAITLVTPGAQVVPLGVAQETDTALPITVIAQNAGEPEGGLAFLFPTGELVPTEQVVVLGVAVETDEALSIGAVVPSSQIIALGVADELDSALRITRLGGANSVFTMNLAEFPPGTVFGAYLTHEWHGHLVPMRRTGSYPGEPVEEQDTDEYGILTFLTLAPGEYVAWSAAYPLRRRFFKVTDEVVV